MNNWLLSFPYQSVQLTRSQTLDIRIPMSTITFSLRTPDGRPITGAGIQWYDSVATMSGCIVGCEMHTQAYPPVPVDANGDLVVKVPVGIDLIQPQVKFDSGTYASFSIPTTGNSPHYYLIYDASTNRITVSEVLDVAAPVVTGTPDRAANNQGWYNAPVAITWSANDPYPSSGTPTRPAPTTASTEGDKVIYSSAPSCDPMNHCATGTYNVSLDTHAPSVSISGVQSGATYDYGKIPVSSCTASDALSGVAVSPTLQQTDNHDGTFTSTCSSAVDNADNSAAPVSLTYYVKPADQTPPVVSGTPDRVANSSGWYNAPVTITWSATDPAPSSGTPTTPAQTVASTEGTNIAYTSGSSCDPSNNCATGTYYVSLDIRGPSVAVLGVQNGTKYLQGRVPAASCSATDALSGVATQATVATKDNGGGSFTATCSGATDKAGNTARPVSVTYTAIPAVYNIASASKSAFSLTSGINTSIQTKVAATTVPVGDFVTVTVAAGAGMNPGKCSDSKGNVYAVSASIKSSSGPLFIWTAKATKALLAGDTITATYSGSVGASVVSVNGVSALATGGVVDKTSTSSGSSASASSGNVATTAAIDLLFGAVAYNNTSAFTPGTGYSIVGAVSTGGLTLAPEFKLLSSTGTYAATGTLGTSTAWRAPVVAYKAP